IFAGGHRELRRQGVRGGGAREKAVVGIIAPGWARGAARGARAGIADGLFRHAERVLFTLYT
ncbi:MAG TPA: hypothetical protein VGD42_16090, partial [Lysobacter sp.]